MGAAVRTGGQALVPPFSKLHGQCFSLDQEPPDLQRPGRHSVDHQRERVRDSAHRATSRGTGSVPSLRVASRVHAAVVPSSATHRLVRQRHLLHPLGNMRRVIVESPYAGEGESEVGANVEYARQCLLDCLKRGESPFASHLLYTQVLDDNDESQRTLGISAGIVWIPHADATVVYVDRSISQGMRIGIAAAESAGIAIEYRRLHHIVAP